MAFDPGKRLLAPPGADVRAHTDKLIQIDEQDELILAPQIVARCATPRQMPVLQAQVEP